MSDYSFGQVTAAITYKGRKIETVESPMQVVFSVDGNYASAYWSVADAKRAIRGEGTKYLPVDVRDWFRK